jgi:hypothetical protein
MYSYEKSNDEISLADIDSYVCEISEVQDLLSPCKWQKFYLEDI